MEKKRVAILFSVPKQIQWFPISILIRFFQFKKSFKPFRFFGLYHSSHVSLLIDEMVYEAVFWLGVRKIPYGEWEKLNKVKLERVIWIDDINMKKGIEYLEKSLGISYAFLELFGILLNRIMKIFFKKELYGNPFKTVIPKVKCSELAYDFLIETEELLGLKDTNLVEVCDIEEAIGKKDLQ